MATETEVITILRASIDNAKNELIRDFCEFIDYCTQQRIYPSKADFDRWLRVKYVGKHL